MPMPSTSTADAVKPGDDRIAAEREAHVLREMVEPGEAPGLARILAKAQRVAERGPPWRAASSRWNSISSRSSASNRRRFSRWCRRRQELAHQASRRTAWIASVWRS